METTTHLVRITHPHPFNHSTSELTSTSNYCEVGTCGL